MPLEPRKEIARLKACYHGGPVHAELEKLGLKAEEVIDFSVSSNPFSYPPAVAEAACNAVINRYPDSESTELREQLAGQLGVPADSILVGSGFNKRPRVIIKYKRKYE